MNHQHELDDIIRSMAPSPGLENRVEWFVQNVSTLRNRINRISTVNRHLEAKPYRTKKESRIHKKYKGKMERISAVLTLREHLLSVALYRIRLQGKIPSVLKSSDERES